MSGPSVMPDERPPTGCLAWLVAGGVSGAFLGLAVVLSFMAIALVRWP